MADEIIIEVEEPVVEVVEINIDLNSAQTALDAAAAALGALAEIHELLDGFSVPELDNIPVAKHFTFTGAASEANFAARINALPGFSIDQKQIPVFIATNPTADSTIIPTQYKFILNLKGKGNYGVGSGTTLSAADITILFISQLTATGAAAREGTQVIPFGEIGSTPVHQILTEKDPSIGVQSPETGYRIATATIFGVPVEWFFIGDPGSYGVGGLPAIASMFKPFGNLASTTAQNLTQVLAAGPREIKAIFFNEEPEAYTFVPGDETKHLVFIGTGITEVILDISLFPYGSRILISNFADNIPISGSAFYGEGQLTNQSTSVINFISEGLGYITTTRFGLPSGYNIDVVDPTTAEGNTLQLALENIYNSLSEPITQLIDGAPSDANTLNELNNKILAINAIIGGATADGDLLVNTVTELLAIFQTYPEGSDIATILAGKINSSDIVNNLLQVAGGKVLDGRQGKILKDLIDALSTTVAAHTASISANTTAISANTASIVANTAAIVGNTSSISANAVAVAAAAAAVLLRQESFIKFDQHILAPTWGAIALNAVIGSTYTLTGSLTLRNFADTNVFTRTARVAFLTTAVAGNYVSGRQVTAYFNRNLGFDYLVKFGASENAALAAVRYFVGMSSANNTSGNVEPDAQTNALGFVRLSGSNNWHVAHNDASGVATTHDTGFPANTESDEVYEGRIRTVPTGIEFTLTRLSNNAVYQYTATGDIPAATFNHGLFTMCTNNTNAAICGLDWFGHKLKLGA
jgi:hypothetical protein